MPGDWNEVSSESALEAAPVMMNCTIEKSPGFSVEVKVGVTEAPLPTYSTTLNVRVPSATCQREVPLLAVMVFEPLVPLMHQAKSVLPEGTVTALPRILLPLVIAVRLLNAPL